MPSCVVKWCRNHTDHCSQGSGITFHVFPQNLIRKNLWTKAVQLERHENNWIPTKSSKICSIHFKNEDFYLSKKGFTMLSKTAIPICTMVLSSEKSTSLTRSGTSQPTTNKKQNVRKEYAPEITRTSKPKLTQLKSIKIENLSETSGLQKLRLVSCPSCGHHFDIAGHLNVEDSNERLAPLADSIETNSEQHNMQEDDIVKLEVIEDEEEASDGEMKG